MRAAKGLGVVLVGLFFLLGLSLMLPLFVQADTRAASSPPGRWVSLTTSGLPGQLGQVQFLDSDTALAVVDGAFCRSNDGGISWFEISKPGASGPFFFLDFQHGWMMDTQYGDEPGGTPRVYSVLKTTDGGSNWTKTTFFDDEDADLLFLNEIVFLDEERGFLIGSGRKGIATYIWDTRDGGRTWSSYNPGDADWSMDGALAGSFPDKDNGWIVAGWETNMGEGSSILHTADGGLSWERQYGSEAWPPTGSHVWYRDVDFVDLKQGWVVGSAGTVLHTADGGTSWEKQPTPTVRELYSVDFIDHLTGWAVGEGGTILFTSDGGHSWVSAQCPTSSDLWSVQFLDDQHCWALSSSGELLKYSASGLAFGDVPDYRDDIIVLAREGIVQGYDDGTFRPDNPVLRAQLAKMLVGALGFAVTNGAIPCSFTDVPTGSASDPLYPDDFVAVAAKNGLVQGFSSTSFRPYIPVTRIQMVSMVVRALERFRPGRLEAPPSDWDFAYAEATDPTHGRNVRLAQYNGLLCQWSVWETDLWAPATRGEMARLLWTAFGGDFPPLVATAKSTMTLSELRAQLLAGLDPEAALYLPTELPSGWAIALPPIPGENWGSGANPSIGTDYNGRATGYRVVFTNGQSTVELTWPFSGDPSEGFSGFHSDGIGYDGDVHCLVLGDLGQGLMLHSQPWEREIVQAIASATEQVR